MPPECHPYFRVSYHFTIGLANIHEQLSQAKSFEDRHTFRKIAPRRVEERSRRSRSLDPHADFVALPFCEPQALSKETPENTAVGLRECKPPSQRMVYNAARTPMGSRPYARFTTRHAFRTSIIRSCSPTLSSSLSSSSPLALLARRLVPQTALMPLLPLWASRPVSSAARRRLRKQRGAALCKSFVTWKWSILIADTYSADLQCVCTNANFQAAARECLTANCTAAELTSALALQDQECASSKLIGLSTEL